MLVALILAGTAVLLSVVLVVMGRGGELAPAHPDYPPLNLPDMRHLLGSMAGSLRLPRGLWGYHTDITDEALHRLAAALDERDARVVRLEQELVAVRRQGGQGGLGDPAVRTLWDDTLPETGEPQPPGAAGYGPVEELGNAPRDGVRDASQHAPEHSRGPDGRPGDQAGDQPGVQSGDGGPRR